MTLNQLIIEVKQKYPSLEKEKVIKAVNELEARIASEIFSPSGVAGELDSSKTADGDRALLLKNADSLYTSYIISLLALDDRDIPLANAHTTIFNQLFADLAADYRRRYMPIKNTPINGGVFD